MGCQLGFINTSDSKQEQISATHAKNSYKQILVLNGKEVSFDLLYTMLGKRFHECLKENSKDLEPFHNMSDSTLVHTVCRKERLTFFNFLRMNAVQSTPETGSAMPPLNEEDIKEMINREY